jgi:predicted ArsR family transcriptional regulator
LERDRFTVADAAKALGISESAIRKRVSRNQIEYEREEDGRLYVYLSSRDRVADTVRDELVNELRDRLAFLERELDDRKEESRRKDTIIAQLTQRIPAIEAPQEPSEAPEMGVDEQQGRGGPVPDAGGPQEPAEPRSWWRRWLG